MRISGVTLTGLTVTDAYPVVTSGLELYYDPSQAASYPGSGSTIYDLSPSGANGTLTGSPTDAGNWFTFNGSQTLATPNLAGLYTGWQHTLEVWINPSISCSGFSDLGAAPPSPGYHTTGLEFYPVGPFMISNMMLWSTTSTTRIGGGTTPLNAWYQYVRVYNGTDTAWAYVNKVKSSDTSIAWIPPSPGWYLNFGGSDSTFFATGTAFQGKLGVVRLYNRVLSQAEITQNYNANRATYGL